MDKIAALYCGLLSSAIGGRNGSPLFIEDIPSLNDVFLLAQEQNTLPLILNAAVDSADMSKLETFPHWKKLAKSIIISQTLKANTFYALYGEMTANGFHPLLVKGELCAFTYPKPELRTSSDMDLLIPSEEFPACCNFLLGKAYVPDKEIEDSSFEVGFSSPDGILTVELHRALFPEDSAVFSSFNRYFEPTGSGIQTYACGESHGVRSLSPQTHFLFLLLHAYKHFIHSGFGTRQLADIGLWCLKYGQDFDWQILLRDLTETRALTFSAAVLSLCRDVLSLPVSIPDELSMPVEDAMPLLDDTIDGGVFGASTRSRLHSSGITLNAVEADRERRSSSLLHSLFPPRSKLTGSYPVLKQHPVLLPGVWFVRFCRYGKELLSSDSDNRAGDSIQIAEARKELLRRYHIIDG